MLYKASFTKMKSDWFGNCWNKNVRRKIYINERYGKKWKN